jgi:simple sugar transport system ATP-binding protein
MTAEKVPNSSSVREIRLQGITKHFGPIQALAGVDLILKAGAVHAVLGENGAGKSTLMKILFGLYRPDGGTIYFDGQITQINSSAAAMRLGLGFVQQHFSLVDNLTVAENILLGILPNYFYHPRSIQQQIQSFIEAQGFDLHAGGLVSKLSVGEKQRVEIIKALYRWADFIIFDEPTSVLAPQEVETFFSTIRQLRAEGKGLVFISHKLDEVMRISDQVTILRDGKNIATLDTRTASAENLARLMIGEVTPALNKLDREIEKERSSILQVGHLRVRDDRGHRAVNDISFELRSGEILGIAGVDGSGQRELAEAIMRLRKPEAGTIAWKISYFDRRRIGFVPPDRLNDAFVPEFSVAENLLIERSDSAEFRRAGLFVDARINSYAKTVIGNFNVLCKGPQQKLRELSGGNQQKLLLGRALNPNPEVLVAMNPTWGVDVAATAVIHQRLLHRRQLGGSVLLFSTDLDEIYSLCDRFFVLYAGRLMGWATAKTSTTQVGLWMTGRTSEQVN